MKHIFLAFTLLFTACSDSAQASIASPSANVIAVSTSGSEFSYNFAVTLRSDETGCAQYANWWEVLRSNGTLAYRRILVHSHPDTQPFKRSGGSVNIAYDEIVYIRAHFNKLGYKGDVFKGSVKEGFSKTEDNISKTAKVELQLPQPNGCLF